MGALILAGLAGATPLLPVIPTVGHLDDVVMVKVHDGVAWTPSAGFQGGSGFAGVAPLLRGAGVSRRAQGRLPGWYRIRTPDGPAVAAALAAHPDVAFAYLAFAPAPPPADLPPTTPDFTAEQLWLDPIEGLGFTEGRSWPGGRGENVTIADVEYGWDPAHEDLGATPAEVDAGWPSGAYVFHGNSVLGELVGGDNGYGIVGAVPDAGIRVISPFETEEDYDVAAAVAAATELLAPGDVLLIEQQAYVLDTYGPVEIDPGVFDAIRAAVDAGIVVVEPAGNGGLDLDDPELDGWFDPVTHDSGAILVGGGASPLSGFAPRSWFPWGSCYGSRVDVQGWYDHIVTTTSGEYDGYYADLFYPDDGLQAYTQSFSGTSGASPMVTAVAAILPSVAIAVDGAPWAPSDVRAAIRSTGSGQTGTLDPHVGPLPDLRRLLRTYLSR